MTQPYVAGKRQAPHIVATEFSDGIGGQARAATRRLPAVRADTATHNTTPDRVAAGPPRESEPGGPLITENAAASVRARKRAVCAWT